MPPRGSGCDMVEESNTGIIDNYCCCPATAVRTAATAMMLTAEAEKTSSFGHPWVLAWVLARVLDLNFF
eukprot:COSAG01_NODE_2213_length_8163_cov_18.627327_11_plen_69_part_00